MSTLYRFNFEVTKLKKEEIKKVEKLFNKEDFSSFKDSVSINYEQSLSDEEYHRREICESIWEKLKRYVPITVTVTCLEYLPYETYEYTKDEYKDFKKFGGL